MSPKPDKFLEMPSPTFPITPSLPRKLVGPLAVKAVFIPNLFPKYFVVLLKKLVTPSVIVVNGFATSLAKLPAAPSTVCAALATPDKAPPPAATDPSPDNIVPKPLAIAAPIPGIINIIPI